MHDKRILRALRAAFPLTLPILTGFLFLGMAYGMLMRTRGFHPLYPTVMAMGIYGGSLEYVAVDLLPSLPVFIGGYASMLKDLRNTDAEGEGTWDEKNQLITIGVHCADEQFLMEIDRQGITRQTGAEGVSFVRHSQESGTNAVTMWMLNALRQMKERTA